MLTGICLTGPIAGIAAIYFWRRNKSGWAFVTLLVYSLLITALSAGPVLEEAGKATKAIAESLDGVGQFLLGISQKLPR